MGLFFEQVKYKSYGETITRSQLNNRGIVASGLAFLALVYGSFSEGGLDILGDRGNDTPIESRLEKVKKDYEEVKSKASPAQLFALRYTDSAQTRALAKNDSSRFYGIFDLGGEDWHDYTIKDGCLNNTAYDINGGDIKFSVTTSGILHYSRVEVDGDIPTAAAQASLNPENDILTIKSGNSRPDDLQFKKTGIELKPLGSTTRNILATYGCRENPKITNIEGEYGWQVYGNELSPYLTSEANRIFQIDIQQDD